MRRGLAALLLLAAAPAAPAAQAATPALAHRVLAMVYDVTLYQSELDRVLREAERRGVYGGGPAAQARDEAFTRTSLQNQRDAVLALATRLVADRATDAQLQALLVMAQGGTPDNPALVPGAVSVVKAGFNDALWDQVARTARGNSEFPCTNDARNRC